MLPSFSYTMSLFDVLIERSTLFLGGFLRVYTVPVDPVRYAGKWFEVGRIPTRFQPNTTSSTAEYTYNADTQVIQVQNKSYSGTAFTNVVNTINGFARPYTYRWNGSHLGKFLVTFPNSPVSAPYWVIDLDQTNYQFAIVSDPARRFCWVLSRTKPVAGSFTPYINKLRNLGFGGKTFIIPYESKQVRI